MKFTISDTKSGFARAVNRSLRVSLKSSKGKGFMPILKSILLEADKQTGLLKVSGTDASTSVVNFVRADIEKSGTALVDANKLTKFVFSKPGMMFFHQTKVNLIAKSPNGSKVNLKLNAVSSYPKIPSIPLTTDKTSMSGDVLIHLFSTYIMASEKSGPFSGVYLSYGEGGARSISMSQYGGGIATATSKSTGEIKEFLVPANAANLLNQWVEPGEDVKIYIDDRKAFFVTEFMYVVTVSINGLEYFPADKFAELSEIELASEAVFDADKFIEAVRACSDMVYDTKEKDNRMSERLRIYTSVSKDGCLMKTSEKNEEGYAEYVLGVIGFTGVPFDFILNALYSRNIILSLGNLVSGMSSIKKDIRKKIVIGHSEHHIYFKSNYTSSVYVMAKVAPG